MYKVQSALDANRITFFFLNTRGGTEVIKECFDAVVRQGVNSAKMDPIFRQFVEDLDEEYRFEWPTSDFLGNATKDIVQTYVKNVTTNLYTHRKKRLREFLRMTIYTHQGQYTSEDINHTIAWAIHGNDTIRGDSAESMLKRQRRDSLLEIIRANSWFVIEHTNVSRYTKKHWFCSIQMWLSMQRQIDQFNTDNGLRNDRIEHRRQIRQQQRRNRQQQKQQQQSQPESESQSKPKKVNKPPKVKNLAVIPICDIQRMHYPIDNFTFYKLLCGTCLIPKCESKRKVKGKYERNVTQDEFLAYKEMYWNEFVYLRRIKWFVRRKKNFRFRMMSDGIAVSLQYDVPEMDCKPLDKEKVVNEYERGEVPGEVGLDPGDKTMIAFVYRDVKTGKEVN